MADLFEITGRSLKTAAEGTFKNPGVWIIVALLTAVISYILVYFLDEQAPVSPLGIVMIIVALLLTFIVSGAFVKTLRNETPSFKDFGKTFKEGFLYILIMTIFNIILISLAVFMLYGTGTWGALLNDEIDVLVYCISMAICWIILGGLIVLVFVLANPASVAFGRTGKFSSAFKLTNLIEMTNTITWGKGIFGTILQAALSAFMVITIFAGAFLFSLIPVAGNILAVIFVGLFLPFAIIFCLNFCSRLYEGVNYD